MAAAPAFDIGTLLEIKPSASGGRLCLAGTGISVRQISWLYNEGLTPEEILVEYPHLSLPGIYAAITYYLANKAKMDSEAEADQRQSERDRQYYEKHGRLPGMA
jgi:uncharacterized protein (DUF433 family)